MICNPISLSVAGSTINEDAIGFSDSFAFVIDGATGLNNNNIMHEDSDAKWFSSSLAKKLSERLSNTSFSISTILNGIMIELAEEWKGNPKDYPSASIAIFRENSNTLEYFGLADCDASVILTSGKSISWEDSRVKQLDESVLASMVNYCMEHKCSMNEAHTACMNLLRKNRKLKNTEGGYWILDPSGIGITHARTANIPLKECSSLFLCSDGFSQLVGFGEYNSIHDLHISTQRNGIMNLKERLFELQENDTSLIKLPRFKFRDDISAFIADIEV